MGIGSPMGGAPNATVFEYVGSDGTDGFNVAAPDRSRIRLEGFRLQDGRRGASGGSGINLQVVKNLVALYHLSVVGWPDDDIQIGAPPGQSSDCIDIDEVWVGTPPNGRGRYGINLYRIDNNVRLGHIKGDSKGQQSLISLVNLDAVQGSGATVSVTAAKLETDTNTHLLRLGHSFFGAVAAIGLIMRGPTAGAGGDVVNINNASVETLIYLTNLVSSNHAAHAVSKALVNDVGNSVSYGIGAKRMALWIRQNNTVKTGI